MECAPVILFVFNRPMHMARTVAALQANELAEQTPLFIFCDGQRNEKEAERVRQVREQAKTVTGFKSVTIVEREKTMALPAPSSMAWAVCANNMAALSSSRTT